MGVEIEKHQSGIEEEPDELSIAQKEQKEEDSKLINSSEQCLEFIVTEENAMVKGSQVWNTRCNEAVVFLIPDLKETLDKKDVPKLILSDRDKDKIKNLIEQLENRILDSFEPRENGERGLSRIA